MWELGRVNMVKAERGKFLVIIFAFATAFSAIHIKIKEVLQHLIEADKNAYRIFHCHFPSTPLMRIVG